MTAYPLALYGSMVAAAADPVTLIALIAALGGLFGTGVTYVLGRRTLGTTARKDYVEGALAAQQAIIDLQAKEDTRLRALNESRLKRIEALGDEVTGLHGELAACRRKCEDCLKRVAKLERELDK